MNPMSYNIDYDISDFQKRFETRLGGVKERTRQVFEFKEVDAPPFLVNSAFYHLFGTDPETIPDGYYDDPAVMTRFQEASFYEQITAVDDDFVPYLVPWFGTAVLSSALGAKVVYHEKADPSFDPTCFPIEDEDDIRNLEIADPEKDGLMPTVLQCIRFMKETSFLPVGITDCQGPLATANQLVGYDKLIFMMKDSPDAVHELMDKITESLILWIKRQKVESGEALNECIGDQQVYVGEHAGVWLSDDDAVLWSPDLYREFVVPYNSIIFKEFGGGILHYCGNANHQVENLLNTGGLIGLNVYALHDLKGICELKRRIEERLVLFVCDFAPLDHRTYYKELLSNMSFTGLVVDCQLSPVISLTESGYGTEHRDKADTRKELIKSIQLDEAASR